MFICQKCIDEKMEYAHGFMWWQGYCEMCDGGGKVLDARQYKVKINDRLEGNSPQQPHCGPQASPAPDAKVSEPR